jgi:methyl-accepting chemotaxis protein
MKKAKDPGTDGLRMARLLPQWFKDLDAAHKPVVSSVVLIVLAAPVGLLTILEWLRAGRIEQQINDLLAAGGSRADLVTLTEQFQSANDKAQLGIVLTAAIAWAGALFIAVSLTRLTVAWLRDATVRVRRAARGDLTTRIVRDNGSQIGDIQEALGKMIASFQATVARIDTAAVDLRDSAGEMVGISDEAGGAIGDVARSVAAISVGAGSQVDLIGDTSREVGEIEQAVREAAGHAVHASEESAATELLTEEGVRRAAEIERAMQNVHATALGTSETIRSLGDKSTDIDQIVRSIADIAEQTNLLALNAAIEAARAGEQGRGFAVVAEEVRKLAEDAQHSTGEIAELTEQIRAQTDGAVAAVEAGSVTVERGVEAVSLNRRAFAEISAAVGQLNEATSQISDLAAEIADQSSRVRVEIEDIASVAQQSSASTQQVSAATEESAASAQEVTATAGRVTETATALAELAARFTFSHDGDGTVVAITAAGGRSAESQDEERAA